MERNKRIEALRAILLAALQADRPSAKVDHHGNIIWTSPGGMMYRKKFKKNVVRTEIRLSMGWQRTKSESIIERLRELS